MLTQKPLLRQPHISFPGTQGNEAVALCVGDKSGLHIRSCQDSADFPPTKAKTLDTTEAELVWPRVTLGTRKRSSFCELNVRTAHISVTADTLNRECPLVPEMSPCKSTQRSKMETGFTQRLPKTMKEKGGSGEGGGRGTKTVMILKKHRIRRAMVAVCHWATADEEMQVIVKDKEWHNFSKMHDGQSVVVSQQNLAHPIHKPSPSGTVRPRLQMKRPLFLCIFETSVHQSCMLHSLMLMDTVLVQLKSALERPFLLTQLPVCLPCTLTHWPKGVTFWLSTESTCKFINPRLLFLS